MSTTRVDNTSFCLHHMFEDQVNKMPDSIAVIFEDKELTFKELHYYASKVAAYLQQLGIGSDVLVGICVERSVEMIVGILGILMAGGAYVPIDPTYPNERISFMLEDSQLSLLLTQEKLLSRLPQNNNNFTKTCLEVFLDDNINEFNKFKIGKNQISPNNIAYVIYTSGSTGKPKGVMIPHRGVVNRILWMQEEYKLHRDDRVLQKTPFSFDVSVWEFFWSLSVGAKLVISQPEGHKDTSYLVNLINKEQITIIHFVPSMLQIFLKEKDVKSCTSLRLVFCSGEVLSIGIRDKLFTLLNAELHNLYGPTEASIDVTYYQCKPETIQSFVPIGRPIANTQIYILDSDLKPLLTGEVGELHIGGIGLARGYLNRPELTKEKFIPNPFSDNYEEHLYKTGDLARYLSDGNIEYIGRIDNQVKIRGHRIELGEIESLINEHPNVLSSVAIVYGNTPDHKRLILYVMPDEAQVPSIGEMRQFLSTKAPEYMIPAMFILLSNFPLTPNGKIDRKALPQPKHIQEREEPFIPPRHNRELQMVSLWENILDIKPIGVKDNFFNLGGDSLQAVSLFMEIEEIFSKRLSLDTLFQAPTVELLLNRVLQEEKIDCFQSLVPIQPKGCKPPLFCIHAAGGHLLFLRPLARHLSEDQPVYGLQSLGLDGLQSPLTRIEDMASHYISEITTFQSEEPYFIVGYSLGGLIAFEMAQQWKRQGKEVAMVMMIDSMLPALLNEIPLESYYAPISTINRKAARQYKPHFYPGSVILFRAEEQSVGKIDRFLGWAELANKVFLHELPSNHYTIIEEPSVSIITKEIESCINRIK